MSSYGTGISHCFEYFIEVSLTIIVKDAYLIS